MIQHRALGMTIAVLILTSLACNAFAGERPPAFGPPPTAIAEERVTVTSEMAATATLPSGGLGLPAKVTMLVDLNVRNGPGVQYDRVGFLLEGDEVPITGVHQESGWWLIECPENIVGGQCWVSGGEQYTKADGGEHVASVEAPPTPTPVPPNIEEGTGIVAYVSDGFLYALQLDLLQSPPQIKVGPVQLADVDNVQALAISPDGRRIAFVAGTSEANNLYMVNTDGQDQRLLSTSEELPLNIVQNPSDFSVLVDQIEWLSDSQTVLLNTAVTTLVGLGGGSQEDLWSVNLDGEIRELLSPGEGGGTFVVDRNGQVLLSKADSIARTTLNGSDVEIILQFDPINTASEYIYYPLPQVVGNDVNVVVPAAEPFLEDAQTALWQVPSQGPAVQLGAVDGATLFNPIYWSIDGNRLAFVQQDFNPDAPQPTRLVIADGKGINPDAYAADERLVFHNWSNDGAKFLYSGNGYYTVGKIGAPPVQTLVGSEQTVRDARWITDSAFITAVGNQENSRWELRSADIAGGTTTLAEVGAFEPLFAVWPDR